MMAEERRVYPDCINASNPYHECVEFCFKRIVEATACAGSKQSVMATREVEVMVKNEKKKNFIPYLPEEIIFMILVTLPADSVHNFRLVCRIWYKLISDPIFIEAHLLQSEWSIIIRHPRLSWIQKMDTFSIKMEEGGITKKYPELCSMGWIITSCNGLLLLQNKLNPQVLHVTNPVTKQFVTLPSIIMNLDRGYPEAIGLAFVPSTGEYKVVHIINDWGSFEILTLGFNTWREIHPPVMEIPNVHLLPLIVVNGVFHWISFVFSILDKYIVSIDAHPETLHVMRLPDHFQHKYVRFLEFGGYLSLLTKDILTGKMELWSLKDFYRGDWILQQRISLEDIGQGIDFSAVFIASLKNGKVVVCKSTNRHCGYYVHNTELKRTRLMPMKKELHHLFSHASAMAHVDSLVTWRSCSQKSSCSFPLLYNHFVLVLRFLNSHCVLLDWGKVLESLFIILAVFAIAVLSKIP